RRTQKLSRYTVTLGSGSPRGSATTPTSTSRCQREMQPSIRKYAWFVPWRRTYERDARHFKGQDVAICQKLLDSSSHSHLAFAHAWGPSRRRAVGHCGRSGAGTRECNEAVALAPRSGIVRSRRRSCEHYPATTRIDCRRRRGLQCARVVRWFAPL